MSSVINDLKKRNSLAILILTSMLFSIMPGMPVHAAGVLQSDVNTTQAQEMLAKMTPEEKVGQLFLVTFTGSNADEKSQIYDLITRYHIGGVVLRTDNDNFIAAPDTISDAYQLVAQLQDAERQASIIQPISTSVAGTPTAPPAPTTVPANYIPLLTGISQEGDGSPNDQIFSGLTPLPDLMALGASWDPSLAEKVGTVAGQELSSLGLISFLDHLWIYSIRQKPLCRTG